MILAGRMSEDRVVLGGFDRAEARLSAVRHLVLSACGTSLYAAMYGAKLMRDLEALDTATVGYTAAHLSDIIDNDGGTCDTIMPFGHRCRLYSVLMNKNTFI